MRSMKSIGLEEVQRLRRRTIRLVAMGRMFKSDGDFIVKHLDEVEARIVAMTEMDEFGKEET